MFLHNDRYYLYSMSAKHAEYNTAPVCRAGIIAQRGACHVRDLQIFTMRRPLRAHTTFRLYSPQHTAAP